MKDLPKAYNPKEVEDEIYRKWEASGYFNPDNLPADEAGRFKEPFSIAMPPPNATAALHVGHSMFLTIQDIMTRFARMSGKKTLWLPGTDHAAIATNFVVERQIWETEKKTRKDLGREEFLRRVDAYVEKTRGTIGSQIRKMGSSCDWSREKYTFSPELSLAVRTVFKKMYDGSLIYRGSRIVNWCPRCGTTLADDEVLHKPLAGTMYYIRYPLAKSKDFLVVATARPDTMLGDTAVAVNPKDPRYKKFVGTTAMLPLLNRELPVIADEHVDMKFGTGAMKVTPGHDQHDFEIAQRHKLDSISLLGEDGKILAESAADYGFESYSGLAADEAREKIVAELTSAGFIEKTEKMEHSVGRCYRCDAVVEPIVSKQWFVNVNGELRIENDEFRKKLKLKEKTTLREMAMAAVKSGAIKIVPERFTKTYLNWIENLRDWNISRQIWYGHKIPVWYCDDCEEVIVAIEEPAECPKCKSVRLLQDPDTLDTWFSSSLWTFSTLGWPLNSVERASPQRGGPNNDLKTYHPTTIMETGYDILFFWVARMVLATGFAVEDIPFQTVYLNGLVRDIGGKKMSKSLRNVLNPLEVIEKFGTDALRLSMVIGTTAGNDLKISEQKIETYRNFVNKLWNISRFILSSQENSPSAPSLTKEGVGGVPEPKSLADQWILSELDNLIAAVHKNFAAYQYGQAGEALYDFTWNKFADWYIEISKIRDNKLEISDSQQILRYVLQNLLRMWHPFIPFVTEHIWSQFNNDLLMIQQYPSPILPLRKGETKRGYENFSALQDLITGLRNLRSEFRQPPAEIFATYIQPAPQWLTDHLPIVEKLARVRVNSQDSEGLSERIVAASIATKKMPYFLWEKSKIYLIIPHFDAAKELALTQKDLNAAEAQIAKYQTQLSKKDFLKKAPPQIVEKLKTDAAAAAGRAEKLQEKIKLLK